MSKFSTPFSQFTTVHNSAITGLGDQAQDPLAQKGELQGSSAMSLDAIDQVMAGYRSSEVVALDSAAASLNLGNATSFSSPIISSAVIDSTAIISLPMGWDGNNSLGSATNLDSLTGLRINQGYVGSGDTVDYYRFSLSGIRDLTLSLTGLSADADLQLIQDANNNGVVDAGEVLAFSSRSGNLNESLNKVLGSGTYFAAIQRFSGDTNYEFRSYAKLPQVNVDVTRVRAIDGGIDFGSQADFYSKITIDGSTYTTDTVSNDNDISPNWSYSKTVDGTSRYVSVGIQMWDSDGGLAGADDHVDIDAATGLRDINVWYDLLTNQITGDINGNGGSILNSSGGGDSDRAQAFFKVSEGDWFDRNLTDDHLTNLTRNAGGVIDRQEMITLLREAGDYDNVTGSELTDLRTIVDDLYQPEAVDNLANKVVNGDVANIRAGFGNLYAGATATHLENLVGKWFLGNDRPDIAAGTTYRYTNGSLFQSGISTDDIDQGGVGDCYFMASLSAAAQDKPFVISNLFTDNGDGTFTVRFYKPDGSRDYVTVDRYLATTGSGYSVYAGWGGGTNTEADNELWAALAEKAYAQVNESGWIGQDNTNSYAGISGGWMDNVMNQLTGYSTTSRNATAMTCIELVNLVNSSKMLTVGFVNGTIPGVVNEHAYTITSYNPTTGLFHLDNPWGYNDANVTFEQLQSMQGWIQYTNV